MRQYNIDAIRPTDRLNDLYSVSCAALGGSLHIESNNRYLLWNTGKGYKFDSFGDEVTEGTHLIKFLKETAPDLLADYRSKPFIPKNPNAYNPKVFKQQMERFFKNDKKNNTPKSEVANVEVIAESKPEFKRTQINYNEEIFPDEPIPQDASFTFLSKPDKIKTILSQVFKFRYHEITGKIQFCKKDEEIYIDFTDRHFNTLRTYLLTHYFNAALPEADLRMVIESDFSPSYCPIRDYFETIPAWDGNDYIKELAELAKIKQGQFGEDKDGKIIDVNKIWYLYLRRWLIATVATMTGRYENHTCLTLLGDQGIGKTTFLRNLGIQDDLVYVGALNPADKDSKILYAEKVLIVLDELEATTRHELASIKSQMTLSSISVRRAYGRRSEVLPRRASFCASANDVHVLGDLTGSRRWLCLEVQKTDYKAVTPELMRNVYSQAFQLLNNGEKYWFDNEEIQKLEKRNSRFYSPCAEEEALLKYYSKINFDNTNARYLTNSELLQELSFKFPSIGFSSKKLGQVLAKQNFERGKKGGVYCYAVNPV